MRNRSIYCVAVVTLLTAAGIGFTWNAGSAAGKSKAPVDGTAGRIAKWITGTELGSSEIVEDKFGKVGVGTNVPTSKLTVAGTIESQSGGIKFPDGTVQTTAMQDPALSAFQTKLDMHYEVGVASAANTFAVPSGKRLVIETLTLRANTGIGGLFATCNLTTRVNGVEVSHQCIPTFIRTGGPYDYFGYQNQVRLYADGGGSEVFLGASRTGTGSDGNLTLTISGYLVDLP